MSAMKIPATTQVLVIGGGPSGSTVSTLMAQQGLQVTLLERETFPRFHIGESLIPETYWVLQRLKMLDKLKKSHFIRKESVQFVSASGRLSEPFYFTQHKPGEQSQTWQVLRSEFDQMMLENAREQGVNAFEGVRVLEVLFDGTRAVGARIIDPEGDIREIRAEVVVDASGQSAMISSKFKLRTMDPLLKKGAVWTYWEGAYRDKGVDEGATIVLQTTSKKGWFWYIPLHNNIMSVGVVSDFDYIFKGRGDHETIYNEELERCPRCQRTDCQGQTSGSVLCHQGLLLPCQSGRRGPLGSGRRRFWVFGSALFFGCAARTQERPNGGRCDRRRVRKERP
jgi:flavin-dependent dehydrogenase